MIVSVILSKPGEYPLQYPVIKPKLKFLKEFIQCKGNKTPLFRKKIVEVITGQWAKQARMKAILVFTEDTGFLKHSKE